MKRTVTRTAHSPCQLPPANPRLHTWHAALAKGWFTCEGCGTSGYCPLCLMHGGASWEG